MLFRSPALLEPLQQPLALQPRQAGDPEHAVELVDLVLEDRGREALRLRLAGGPVEVAVAQADAGGPGDPLAHPRHADAALVVGCRLGGRPGHDGVHVDAGALVRRHPDHHEARGDARKTTTSASSLPSLWSLTIDG